MQGLSEEELAQLQERGRLRVHDAQGRWITPGLVDAHAHFGVYSAPAVVGSGDGNSFNGPILHWMRALDALNTHDESYRLALAGGVTTAVILPGSANAIGLSLASVVIWPVSLYYR